MSLNLGTEFQTKTPWGLIQSRLTVDGRPFTVEGMVPVPSRDNIERTGHKV